MALRTQTFRVFFDVRMAVFLSENATGDEHKKSKINWNSLTKIF